jgi:hypothetical protein
MRAPGGSSRVCPTVYIIACVYYRLLPCPLYIVFYEELLVYRGPEYNRKSYILCSVTRTRYIYRRGLLPGTQREHNIYYPVWDGNPARYIYLPLPRPRILTLAPSGSSRTQPKFHRGPARARGGTVVAQRAGTRPAAVHTRVYKPCIRTRGTPRPARIYHAI